MTGRRVGEADGKRGDWRRRRGSTTGCRLCAVPSGMAEVCGAIGRVGVPQLRAVAGSI